MPNRRGLEIHMVNYELTLKKSRLQGSDKKSVGFQNKHTVLIIIIHSVWPTSVHNTI
jgi:hypothetical protein